MIPYHNLHSINAQVSRASYWWNHWIATKFPAWINRRDLGLALCRTIGKSCLVSAGCSGYHWNDLNGCLLWNATRKWCNLWKHPPPSRLRPRERVRVVMEVPPPCVSMSVSLQSLPAVELRGMPYRSFWMTEQSRGWCIQAVAMLQNPVRTQSPVSRIYMTRNWRPIAFINSTVGQWWFWPVAGEARPWRKHQPPMWYICLVGTDCCTMRLGVLNQWLRVTYMKQQTWSLAVVGICSCAVRNLCCFKRCSRNPPQNPAPWS